VPNFSKKNILISPLDWGLGHATRCIAIIKILEQANYNVLIATSGQQKSLLYQQFPHLQFLDIRGYSISYSKKKWWFSFKIAFQIGKILQAIRRENKWLANAVSQHKIDLVISDNRYGFYSKKIPSIFITHQLTIKAPFVWIEYIFQKINYRYINNFHQCWVPDNKDQNNLSGLLAHPQKLPKIPCKYIGTLSKFSDFTLKNVAPKYDCCFLISGPEPQRSIFENLITQQAFAMPQLSFICCRGLPNLSGECETKNNITFYNHVPTHLLFQIIDESKFIVCRSGYTSIMELLGLGKKTILVPTPGQTEQEYLAIYLSKLNFAITYSQNLFNLNDAYNQASQFNYTPYRHDIANNESIISLLENIFNKSNA
jgi:uncharacterized protein (TIGR00661 family)